MRRESILLLCEDRETIRRLRGELRGTCYRLLRARNERVAKWLMERVKIALAIVADSVSPQPHAAGPDSRTPDRSEDAAVPGVPMLLLARMERVSALERSAEEAGRPWSNSQVRGATQELCQAAGIPVMQVLPPAGGAAGGSLPQAIQQGADYILFTPYEQSELIQAIRTAMMNGPARRSERPTPPPLQMVLQDRMFSLETGREQMTRLFIGAVEQLQHARARAAWSEAENRNLRQMLLRGEMETPLSTTGLPQAVQGIAHDFSNLLEAAGAAATGVYGDAHSPRLYRDAMQTVMDQARELLGCLMDMTRPQAQVWRTEPVDLDGVVMNALKAALVPLREPQIQVRVRIAGLEPVWAHPSLIYRALVNLLWNAVQAMPNGGMLSILGYVRGESVVLEVGDTGSGISAQDRRKVLREPFSTKDGHYGMGLTLVRELLEKCGGEITFSSRPRQGSLFSIALPIARSGRIRGGPFNEALKRTKVSVPEGSRPAAVLKL